MTKLNEKSIKLNIIVAMNNKDYGIGKDGKLPWKIPEDVKHFYKITTRTEDRNKMNAVIMGRNTWFQFPRDSRPLENRVNIIVSKTLQIQDLDVDLTKHKAPIEICPSLDAAIYLVYTKYANQVESMFAIGGAQIYREALCYPAGFLNKLYLTRVYSDIDCDLFLEPKECLNGFEKLTNTDGNIYDEQFNKIFHDEKYDLEYCFEVYEKRENFI